MKPTAIEAIILKSRKLMDVPFDQKNKIILFFIIGLMLVGYTHIKSNPTQQKNDKFQIDTIIPEGYVLIPIKLSNASAIASTIGSHGVANIYSTLAGHKSKLLFSKAKIIKSMDKDESIFSVLVKESKAHLLSNSEDPFFAAVQNPRARASDVELISTPNVRIIYQN